MRPGAIKDGVLATEILLLDELLYRGFTKLVSMNKGKITVSNLSTHIWVMRNKRKRGKLNCRIQTEGSKTFVYAKSKDEPLYEVI